MPALDLHAVARRLARTAADSAGDGSDPDLLGRFVAGRDEAAFAALVRRHGPMVLDVCRAVLGNRADADDAFQAAFLTLARSAGSVRRPAALAAWLHGVALRTARKARVRAARRRTHEARTPVRDAGSPDGLSWAEVRQAVHEELAGLGERYRAVLVLCCLDDLTHDRAAAALGLSTAAVKKRLERGRAMLRAALTRRGIGPTAVLAAAAPAAVPPALAASTARAAALFAAAPASAAGSVPGSVLTLVGGGKTVLTPKLTLLLLPTALGLALLGGPGKTETLPAGPAAADLPAATEARRLTPTEPAARPLTGTWTIRHVETGGEPLLDRAALAAARVTFAGDRATVTGLRVPLIRAVSYKLDPDQPKAIDVTFLDGPLTGKTAEGIHVVRGDEARVCVRLSHPELGRPKGFVTNSGTTLYTLILDRVKEPSAAPSPGAKIAQRPARTGAPAITVEELAAGLREKGYQPEFVGRQITFTGTVVRAGAQPEVRIEGLEKDLLDTAVLHNAVPNNTLKPGARVRVTGLIVAQWYGVWQVWQHDLRMLTD